MTPLQFLCVHAALHSWPVASRHYGPKRRRCDMARLELPKIHLPHQYKVHDPEPAEALVDSIYAIPLGREEHETVTGFMGEHFSTQIKWAVQHGLLKTP